MKYSKRNTGQSFWEGYSNLRAYGPAQERDLGRAQAPTLPRTLRAIMLSKRAVCWNFLFFGMITLAAITTVGGGEFKSPGSTAQFNQPWGVVVDATGSVYVADSGNHTIRKITPAGNVSTFAGQAGSAGDADGMGNKARFNTPRNITIDNAGDLYVGDVGNGAIRKITPAGVVSTLAKEKEMKPHGLAIDGAGNIYVSDVGTHSIRKITSEGTVTTFVERAAGDDMAIDSVGNLYITDNETIRKITVNGEVTQLAGVAGAQGAEDGAGTAARFYFLMGITVDKADNLYVTCRDRIRKVTPAGVVSTFIPRAARVYLSTGITVDSKGNFYVTEPQSEKIIKITPEKAISTLAGSGELGSADSVDRNPQSSPK